MVQALDIAKVIMDTAAIRRRFHYYGSNDSGGIERDHLEDLRQ